MTEPSPAARLGRQSPDATRRPAERRPLPFRLGAFLSTSPVPGSGQLVGVATVAGLAAATTSASITVPVTVPNSGPDVAPISRSPR